MYEMKTPYYWEIPKGQHIMKLVIDVELLMIDKVFTKDAKLNIDFIKDLEKIIEPISFYTTKIDNIDEIQEWLDYNNVIIKNIKVSIKNNYYYNEFKNCTCYYHVKENESISELCEKTIKYTLKDKCEL